MCTRPFDQNIWSSFIYSFFCARPFDQILGSTMIYFFYLQSDHSTKINGPLSFIISFAHGQSTLHMTIRPNYMVLFYLFYSFSSAQPFDQKLGSSLIYFFHSHTTIWQKYMIFFLSLILSLCMTIRPKNRVLINFFLFVHDHSTGVTLTL